VALKAIREKKAGHDVVVVLSAMAGETNRLIDLAHSAAETPDEREYDSLISTGEQVTISLLSIVLNSMVSFTLFSGISGPDIDGSGLSESKDIHD